VRALAREVGGFCWPVRAQAREVVILNEGQYKKICEPVFNKF
jgi:hypothetical protein